MKLYYTDRRVLFAMCAGNELFYAMLYLCHFTSGSFYMFAILATLCFPVAVLKSAIALLQVRETENLSRNNSPSFRAISLPSTWWEWT